MHENKRPFGCTICDKKWPTEKTLRKHMTYNHKPVPCDMCGSSISNEYELKRHKVLVSCIRILSARGRL